MAEEIKLNVGSNLDEVLKQVQQLKKENEKLSSSYKNLQQSVSSNSRVLQQNLSSLNKSQEFVHQYNSAIDEMKRKNDEAWSNGVAKIKEYNSAYQKLVQSASSSSLRLASSVARTSASMSPISPSEFSGGFSANPASLFGFGDAIKSAFSLMKELQQMRHDLAYLSNSAGDASQAVNTVFSIASGSAISRGTATGVIRSLADQGLQLYDASGKVSPRIRNLGVLAGNLQAATGVAASQWGAFTGELSYNYGVTEEGLASLTSTLVGTGLNAQNLERTMSTVNKVLQNTAFIAGVPSEKALLGLTRTIGGAAKVFQTLKISAEKASTFIEGVLDPENYEKNATMFARLGISASEYAGYLNQANGQQLLLERVMSNLPQLASQIASIRNPFARLEIGKQLGLDSQMVQRFANASKEEIESIMTEFAAANKNQEALQAKKKRMAAESAKFDDYIFSLKMQVLQPVMKMLSDNTLQKFMSVMPSLASSMAKIFEAVTPLAVVFSDAFVKAVPYITDFATGVSKAISYVFGEDGLNLAGKGLEGVVRDSADYVSSKYEGLGINFGGILSVLSKIYLAVKAFQLASFFVNTAKTLGGFVGAGIDKVLGWINPRQKLVMNATVGDLADAIKKSTAGGPGTGAVGGGLLSGLLSTVLVGAAGALLGKFIFGLIFGEKSTKEFENISNYLFEERKSKVEFESGVNALKGQGERLFEATGVGLAVGTKTLGPVIKESIRDGFTLGKETFAMSSVKGISRSTGALKEGVKFGGETFSAGTVRATASKSLAQGIGKSLVRPLLIGLAGVDWYETLTSEKTGTAMWLDRAGTALSTASAAFGVAAVLASPTIVGGISNAAISIGTGILAVFAKTASDTIWDSEKYEKKMEALKNYYGEKNFKEMRDQILEFDYSKNSTLNLGVEAGSVKSEEKSTASIFAPRALNFETFQDYNEQLKQMSDVFEATDKVLQGTDFNKIATDENKIKLEEFIKQNTIKSEEDFLVRQINNAKEQQDLLLADEKAQQLVETLLKKKKESSEIEKYLNDNHIKSIEKNTTDLIQLRKSQGDSILKTEEAFSGIYNAFKAGRFDIIGQVLSKFVKMFKIFIVQLYMSIPLFTTTSGGEKLAKDMLGEEFFKGNPDLSFAFLWRDEDKFKKFLSDQMDVTSGEALSILTQSNAQIAEQNKKQKEEENLREKERKKREEEHKKSLDANTAATVQNSEAIKGKPSSEVRQAARDWWTAEYGGALI